MSSKLLAAGFGTAPRLERLFSCEKITPLAEPIQKRVVLAGRTRIKIELEREPAKARFYSEKWSALARSIASEIRGRLEGLEGIQREDRFLAEIWVVFKRSLKLRNFDGKLYESLETGKFNCNNSFFLFYDVAKLLGIEAEIVSTPGHVLVKTNSFFFETRTGGFSPIEKLLFHYPLHQVLKGNKIQALTYHALGRSYGGKQHASIALKDLSKAIELNPKDADAFCNRGTASASQGDLDSAIKDFSTAIKLNPSLGKAYHNRAQIYKEKGELELAQKDFAKAKLLGFRAIEPQVA